MSELIIPKDYKSTLDLQKTEKAIKQVKDYFQLNLSTELRLRRVTAPLFVKKGTGINDDLNGTEKPVGFSVKNMDNTKVEIVQSLAKWKRLMLADYKIPPGFGLYTDMNAIRPDEEPDNTHSFYVDQWDWEKSIKAEQRCISFLKDSVKRIYSVIKSTEFLIQDHFPEIQAILPEEIYFIHSEELLKKHPNLTPKEREERIAKEHKAVFIIGIGDNLSDGLPHDQRAPDYDDWTSIGENDYAGLNGDIILWNPILEKAFEISSMGIRVDKQALLKQLCISGQEKRKDLDFHKRLLNNELPYSIGGGIGQSRLCMYFLRKAHIGETQSSLWPDEMIKTCKKNKIFLL